MHPSVYKRPLLWVLIIFISVLALFYRPVPPADDVFYLISKEPVKLVAVVDSFYVSKPKSNNAILKVISVNGQKVRGRVYGRFVNIEPRWKDTLEITGKLKRPFGQDILGNFNWRNYLATKGVFTEIKAEQTRVTHTAPLFYRAVRWLRGDILREFDTYFDADLARIAGGILLGERGDLDPELFTKFQDSGAIHLLVASGGNVGFVMFMSVAVCIFLRLGLKSRLAVSLAVAGLYTLVAGADAPLLRAYFMAVCGALGFFLGRNSGLFQGLILSCLAILIVWPASLFETGFQMSFLATLAIIMTAGNFRLPEKWPRGVYFFYQIFLATLASQLVLLPIFTTAFYKVSLAGLAANMVLVPLASCLLGMSFAFYIFAKLHLAGFLFFPTLALLELFKILVEFFAGFSFSAIAVTAWKTGTIICFYAFLFWVFNLPHKNFAKKSFPFIAGLCGVVLLLQMLYFPKEQVCLFRSGKKGVAFIRTPKEVFVIGDTIAPDKVQRALYKLGTKRATALFGLGPRRTKKDFSALFERIIYPFEEDNNIGAVYNFAGAQVVVTDPLLPAKGGGVYREEETKKKNVSYGFTFKDKKVYVGAGGSFILNGEKRIFGKQNQTVCEKI
jgi:competence protein ComEC